MAMTHRDRTLEYFFDKVTYTTKSVTRYFPRPDLGTISGPFPIKNEQMHPKVLYNIPKFLVLHFGESFIKVRTKLVKLQMHEIFIKM